MERAQPVSSVEPSVGQLYAQYFDRLVSSLYAAFGAGPPEPEDVAQRAFAKLIDRDQIDQIENHRAYLWRIATNIALSDKRSQAVRARFARQEAYSPPEGVTSTPERVLETKKQLDLVVEVLRHMPAQRRRVFLLNRIEGLNYTQVGKRIGISRTAVTKHVARAAADVHAALSRDEASAS